MSTTELQLIAARDGAAMSRFYDRRVAGVRRFCEAICPPDRVEDAVEAAMVNFLARATERPSGVGAEDLLRKATREVAASRMQHALDPGNPVCVAMPELLAARINGELPGSESQVIEHLADCVACQASAARLEQAEVAFADWGASQRDVREAWLELAEAEAPVAPEPSRWIPPPSDWTPPSPEPAPAPPVAPMPPEPSRWIPPSQPEPAPTPGPGVPTQPTAARVRARRGGLVGAVREFARRR